MTKAAPLSRIDLAGRGLLLVGGEDRAAFLQGLITNDIARVAADRAIYAALLTAQGRFLHDFFITAWGDGFVLDAEAARIEDLRRRLTIYKLRAKVTLAPAAGDLAVVALMGDGALPALGLGADPGVARRLGGGIVYADPRSAALGARAILPRPQLAVLDRLGFLPGDPALYEARRIALAIPDGSRDLEIERALILENGFEALNGVDWKKGCYVGQEVTARMHYRTLVKKRLVPVAVEGPIPAPGTAILRGGEEIGEIRSASGDRALALVRIDAAAAAPEHNDLTAGESRIRLLIDAAE